MSTGLEYIYCIHNREARPFPHKKAAFDGETPILEL